MDTVTFGLSSRCYDSMIIILKLSIEISELLRIMLACFILVKTENLRRTCHWYHKDTEVNNEIYINYKGGK